MSLFTAGCAGGGVEKKTEGALAVPAALTPEEIAAGAFTPEVMWKMGRVGGFALSADGTRAVYDRTDYDVAANRGATTLWIQDVPADGAAPAAPRQLTGYEANASGAAWGPDGRIWYLSDAGGSSQLWSVAADGTGARQFTAFDGDVEHFGIAPRGDKVFFVRRVKVEPRTAAEIYPDLDKSAARVYDELMVRHWNRWTDGSHLHIFVADFMPDGTAAEGTDIMAGEPYDAPMEPYFDGAEIAWNADGTALAYTCKKMGETEYATSTDSDVYLYDVATGSTTNICKRTGGSASMTGYDKYPVFSPDGMRLAFSSMARPGNEADKERLMVCDLATGTLTDLTADFDQSVSGVSWSEDGAELTFVAPWFGTHQVCRVAVSGGEVKLITRGDHDITAVSSQAGRTVVALSDMNHDTELYTMDAANGALRQLTFVNRATYDNIRMGEVQKRMVRTTDGREMLTWVFLPPDFDATKKYPALLYCQGGPQSTLGWSYRWNFQLIASQGYIVVAPCRRGVPGFGQEWTDQISGDYSGQNMRDYLSAIDEVAREPYVDADRLGCVGASYGGYSAFYLAGTHQKRFKAFISHCGIFNFESMYGETEELFFVNNDYGGSYWSSDPVAKRSYAASPHKFVKNWDTPILIFTGLNDFRIPYTQSLEAHTAARLMGVPSRLVAFENEAHQVFKPQNSMAWNREFFGWLDKYVKNPTAVTE